MIAALALFFFLAAAQNETPQPPPAHRPEIPLEPIPDSRCPNPDANGNYHIGCGVAAPEVIYKVEPEFPDEARGKKVGGRTTVQFIVGIDGKPVGLRIARSAAEDMIPKYKKIGPKIDQKALEAVSQYRFKPATFHGKPVPVQVNVEVNFQIF